jgi:hypothetical protein
MVSFQMYQATKDIEMSEEDKKKYSEWFNRWYHRDGLGIYYGR